MGIGKNKQKCSWAVGENKNKFALVSGGSRNKNNLQDFNILLTLSSRISCDTVSMRLR